MVALRTVDHGNWIKCIALEVTGEQRRFVNPNLFSLAEAYVHSDANRSEAEEYYRCIPFAVYCGDEMVGFAMITYEKDSDFDHRPAYEIYRLMIDKNHQGKGYGREAVMLLLDYIRTFPYGRAENVYAAWHPENEISGKTFLGCGFTAAGTDEDGAVVARCRLNR